MKKLIGIFVILAGLVVLAWMNGYTLTKSNELDVKNAIRLSHTDSSFADAKEDLLSSISENGLVISYTSHAKAMFERTAGVTGQKTPVYDDAEIILFCKADLSHDLVTADPHNIILCPYAIAIYVLHTEPDRVYLSYREQDETQAVTKPISELLASIIADVI
jgi:uncharacterized protein (DUF302 family)